MPACPRSLLFLCVWGVQELICLTSHPAIHYLIWPETTDFTNWWSQMTSKVNMIFNYNKKEYLQNVINRIVVWSIIIIKKYCNVIQTDYTKNPDSGSFYSYDLWIDWHKYKNFKHDFINDHFSFLIVFLNISKEKEKNISCIKDSLKIFYIKIIFLTFSFALSFIATFTSLPINNLFVS